MNPRKTRALAALLSCPTARAAAKECGISESTMRIYQKDAEFAEAYRRRCAELLNEAADRAKTAVVPAVERLSAIIADDRQQPQIHVSACRVLIEYSLRLVEATDIENRLRELEMRCDEHEG